MNYISVCCLFVCVFSTETNANQMQYNTDVVLAKSWTTRTSSYCSKVGDNTDFVLAKSWKTRTLCYQSRGLHGLRVSKVVNYMGFVSAKSGSGTTRSSCQQRQELHGLRVSKVGDYTYVVLAKSGTTCTDTLVIAKSGTTRSSCKPTSLIRICLRVHCGESSRNRTFLLKLSG